MKIVKIVLASLALTLALAGAASATLFYDVKVLDPDGAINKGDATTNITSAQDSYFLPYVTKTDRFFTITLEDAASKTNYSILLDNKTGSGGTYQGISGIDYYFVSRGDETTTTLYKWSGSKFETSLDFTPLFTKTDTNKTLTWEVKYNLGPNFYWYATSSKYNGQNDLHDSTSKVTATPTPAAGLLLASGLIGLICVRRKQTI